MSFSKAKIQRFNDIKPCAPGPTAYNVTVKDKVRGVERLMEPKSPVVSEVGSTHSTPCFFRTPTLLKRKKSILSLKKSKPKELFTEDIEMLKEKIVECDNKDAFIKDLQEQIEEFKEKMSKLEVQKNHMEMDKIEFEKHVTKLNLEYEERLGTLTKKFEDDITKASAEKGKVHEEIILIKKEHEQLKEANKKEMEELKKNCDKFQVLYNQSVEQCRKLIDEKDALLKSKEEELKALELSSIEMQRKHSFEIEKIQKEHQIEIQDIEFEMLKTMTELQKEKENTANKIVEIENIIRREKKELRKVFEQDRQQLLKDTEKRVKKIEENFIVANLFTEAQLKERLDELDRAWKIKLETQEKQSEAILKECQAISEYNIIQCELEKNEAINSLTEKTNELENIRLKYDEIVRNYEQLYTRFKDMQCDLSKVIVELNETRKTLGEELEVKNKALKKFSEDKRAYEVTVKNTQATIDVLTRRLIHSDRDVEQLKKELSDTEARTLQYESKCIQLSNDLKQAQTFNEELEMQYESTIKLNTTEIEQLKVELVRKVDAYKAEADSLTRKLREEKEMTKEMFQQLQEAYAVIDKVKAELEYLETVNSQYVFDSEQSQNELEDYRIREMDWNNRKEKLESVVQEMEHLLEIKGDEVGDLRKQLARLQENSDSHLQRMQYYEKKVSEYEKELDDTAHIHRKYIEQSGKYDELLQKFEQLEMENTENKNRYLAMGKELEEKGRLKEKCSKLKEAYDKLLKKYEQLEGCSDKKTTEEQQSVKERLDNTEAERDTLLGRVDYLENELKEVSQKYADLAGHQNNRQKIKHLVDLKAKNKELIQSNMDLELKMGMYLKNMEKLKKENADLKKCLRKNKVHVDDKENIGSPNRSLNSSRIESPFRERN